MSVSATGLVAYRAGAASQQQLTWFDHSGAARGSIGAPGDVLGEPRVAPDGRFLLYTRYDPQTGADLWVGPTVGAHTPSVFLKTPFDEDWGVFSPDGRWVAYQSNESGRLEIYVRPFHAPGAQDSDAASGAKQWQVSTAGGIEPMWQPNGKAIDYLDPSGAMMAAPITVIQNWNPEATQQ